MQKPPKSKAKIWSLPCFGGCFTSCIVILVSAGLFHTSVCACFYFIEELLLYTIVSHLKFVWPQRHSFICPPKSHIHSCPALKGLCLHLTNDLSFTMKIFVPGGLEEIMGGLQDLIRTCLSFIDTTQWLCCLQATWEPLKSGLFTFPGCLAPATSTAALVGEKIIGKW